MAILGFQVVSTLIGASLLSQVVKHFSFGRLLLCSGHLVRYLYPTNKQLKEAAGFSSKQKDKGKKPRRNHETSETTETFTFLKSTPIELDMEPVREADVISLHFYNDFQWLIDYSVMAFLVYLANECFDAFVGSSSRFHLSLIWCLLGFLTALRTLFSITWLYFKTPEGGEIMIVIIFGFFFLILAMLTLIIPEKDLNLDLEAAYKNFSDSAKKYADLLSPHAVSSEGPLSWTTFRAILAVFGCLFGALFAYPGLRNAKMYLDAVKYSAGSYLTLFLLHLNFYLPIVCILLWFTPVTNQLIKYPSITIEDVHSFRLSLILMFCLLRLCLIRPHLQAYLNIAYTKVENMRKEAGRISNLDFQRLVVRVFYCLCLVALQYILPVVALLFLTCLYKTLSDFSWTSTRLSNNWPLLNVTSGRKSASNNNNKTFGESLGLGQFQVFDWGEDLERSVSDWASTIGAMKLVFTSTVYRGVLGYLVWWTLLCIQITHVFGIFYYNYVVE